MRTKLNILATTFNYTGKNRLLSIENPKKMVYHYKNNRYTKQFRRRNYVRIGCAGAKGTVTDGNDCAGCGFKIDKKG